MKRIAMGSWAYAIGPYAKCPIDFETVCRKVKELGSTAWNWGPSTRTRTPTTCPKNPSATSCAAKMKDWGLEFAGMGADLWGQKLLNTDDPTPLPGRVHQERRFLAPTWGWPHLRIDTVQPPTIFDEVDYATACGRLPVTWKTCCEIAADRGLRVSWEFEPGFAFNKPSDDRPRAGCGGQAQLRRAARHLPRPDGLRGRRRQPGPKETCRAARWS